MWGIIPNRGEGYPHFPIGFVDDINEAAVAAVASQLPPRMTPTLVTQRVTIPRGVELLLNCMIVRRYTPVASLGLVSPGTATDGCLPIFGWKKNLTTFFSHRLWKWWPFLAVFSSPFPSSHVIYPVFFLNSATKLTLCRVSPGAVRPRPLVTPLYTVRV